MQQKKAYKYRLYPTEGQIRILARTFGCCRYVYNWALRQRTDAYYKDGERLSYEGTAQRLTTLKKQEDHAWLNEVSSVPLQQSLRHLDSAFRNFFEGRTEYPTFHKKHGEQSATYASSAFKWDGKSLTLAKMAEPLNIRWSRPLPNRCTPSTVTISKDCVNRYFVSILVVEDIKPLPITSKQVGLDLGLKSMVITSDGHTYGNPRFFAKAEKNLAKAQRRLSKKKKGSKNRAKARHKVAKIHAKIADRRRDYQHKLSTKIIRENQVVCVESLQVKNMVKNHKLAKAIADVGWGEFVRQLEYKAHWYGRTLVKINKFYPSSQRCSVCGHILESLTLDVRTWTCPECGTVHDRDINAAKNVRSAGLTVLNACGEMVRPGRAKARMGASRGSRKPRS
jgi:putative transposase